MTCAELQASPTADLQLFLDTAVDASAASESTVRRDFPCDDGILVAISVQGGPVELSVEPLA